MNILLIHPEAHIRRLNLGLHRISFREAPLTLTTLAALTPPELKASIRIVDENIEPLPRDIASYDLIGISCITGTAPRAYALADKYRKAGKTVVLGGVHVTLQPQEALLHADSIVIGTAERSWPRMLHDFSAGTLKPVYRTDTTCLAGQPLPRRDLQRRWGYMTPHTVMATRGCRGTCDFCAVPAAGFGWHTRPVGEVINEIRQLPGRRFVFNDVSLLEDREYARELLTALIPLKKVWGGLCTTRIGEDDELLELLQKSGCIYQLIGFESVSDQSMRVIRKGWNKADAYRELVDKLHRAGVTVQGCFIFGFDDDTTEVFDATVEAVNSLKIDIPRYAIYTPFPQTPLFERLKAEGRILHENWRYYDTQHVVFQPRKMSPEQLDRGFIRAYEQTFRIRHIARRTWQAPRLFPMTFLGNLAYRLYIPQLRREPNRVVLTRQHQQRAA